VDPTAAIPFAEWLPPRYRVERVLSHGDQGTTLEMFDTSLRRAKAVLKIQKLSDATAPDAATDFRSFCAKLASIHHDRLAVPYTFGTFSPDSGGTFGYTTRAYVSGTPLSGFPFPLPDDAALIVALQVCQGLDALHAMGLFHCDLKPENVIVRRAPGGNVDDLSQCVLIDFSYRRESTAKALNEVTLQYVAPELLQGNEPDVRSDLYAVGVMLYRLLTGRFPFVGASLPELMRRQRAREFASIASLRPNVTRALRAATERLLEPNPVNRPETAQALMALLNESMDVQLLKGACHGGFVGREAELSGCAAALDLRRPSAGVSSVEVHGSRGVGVTAFLRELEDRLEAQGATVLTAGPRAVCGSSLQLQLREAVHVLARRGAATARLAAPATSTDLHDDLFVAAQERRLVLFVDDWRSCDVGELHFLQRLILQDKAATEGMVGRTGRCQVVIGDSTGGSAGGTHGALLGVIGRRVRLDGLSLEHTAQLLRDASLPGLHASRVHAASGGCPKAIRVILDDAARHGGSVDAALATTVVGASDREREGEISALRLTAHGPCLLALALWGDELVLARWQAIHTALGGAGIAEAPVDRLERSGETCVRSRHRHLTTHVASHMGDQERERVVNALLAVTWDDWRSQDPDRLVSLLAFVSRIGWLPQRCRWRVCRALIVLLERGRFADVESAAEALGRYGDPPWWVPLFRDAAQVGSGGGESTQPQQNADISIIDAPAFYRSWIRARGLLRSRYRQEALKILEVLSATPLPCARTVAVALAEDHALAAAEVGGLETVLRLRRHMLARIRRWLPFIRRRDRDRSVESMRTRMRASRRAARYHRVRCRVHMLKGRHHRALSACRRERLLDRATGNLLREAACLNNEGILLIQANARTTPVTFLERCVRLRERLDDERGLVLALNNLAAALSVVGSLGAAAAALNRARVVATRNGLWRLRNSALVNLAIAYGRRGQLRDAQRVLRQARRIGRDEGDVDAHAKALFNNGHVAADAWNPTVGEGFAKRLDALRNSAAESPADLAGDLVRAELAYRSRDWAHLHTVVSRMRAQGLSGSKTAAFEERLAVEAGNDASRRPRRLEHACALGTRLRLVLLRRKGKRVGFCSLSRIVGAARNHGLVREAVEWIVAHLERSQGASEPALDLGLKALSWFEFREGHDDLQIELRARLAGMLRGRGRHAEAWRLIEDTLLRFRRLERKLRRWPRGVHVLIHLQERLQVALTGSVGTPARRGQEMSAALCVQAFDLLMDNRKRSVGADDRHAVAMLQLGAALSRARDRRAFVDEVLYVAVKATGAQRAILITGTAEAHEVRRTVLPEGPTPDPGSTEISWAVVSQVLASGESSLFSDALTSEELASHRSIAVLKLRSLACVPLRASGQVLGALYLDHHGIAGLISQEMMGFLELLGGLIAITLHTGHVEERAGSTRLQLEETYRHLMRAERNRLAGELAGGLVHDLKNVLTAVSGRAQLLRRASQDPQVLRSLDAIEKAAGAGTGLVQRLQECARDHSSQSEEAVDLTVVAHEAIELLAPRLDKARITASLQEVAGALAWGVPGEYREMFLNLFVNACDAMPDGGALSVSFALNREADRLAVVVGDTGCGMTPETRARIFEPFYTTKGNSGTGLGLVVVRSVIVRHGGTVEVESSPGAGTRFNLALPLYSPRR